ncbi:MAG TPA: deoxyribose-phosphate aldolase [Epulopiscium sp.]|nr:deoxyribose-phosphate aldolase [Candidatus Epulonipiscium sp.]
MNMKITNMIDHTILKADATEEEVKVLCEEAKRYQFATVCINPCYIPQAVHLLQGTPVGITTVVGFPLGNMTFMAKAYEAKEAVELGATDVDMVINIGAMKDGKHDYIRHEIEGVVKAAKGVNKDTIVKVILETCLLTKEEIVKACELSAEAGADFVKTSTGFSSGGATIEDIALMRKTVGPNIGVKASGGVRTYEDAKAMVDAGATRIGASASVSITTEELMNI